MVVVFFLGARLVVAGLFQILWPREEIQENRECPQIIRYNPK